MISTWGVAPSQGCAKLFGILEAQVLALGKDGKANLVNRNNLGGITAPVASVNLPTAVRGQSAATYHTSEGRYFVFHTEDNAVAAYKVTPTNPPAMLKA